jgi:hypothetical protein
MSDPHRDKDKLADALQALSEGGVPSESLTDEEHVEALLDEIQHATPAPRVDPPALTDGEVNVPEEVPPSDSPFRSRSQRPLRPPVPGARPIDVVAPEAPPPMNVGEAEDTDAAYSRALTPTRATPPPLVPTPQPGHEPEPDHAPEFQRIVEDDGLLEIPAADAEILASSMHHRRREASGHRGPGQPRSLFVQRTIIPILLTLGLLLPGVAIWLMRMPHDSELYAVGQKTRLYLFLVSPIFLALAIVNMLQVRAALKRTRAQNVAATPTEPAPAAID